MQPHSHYFLARIYEKEKNSGEAINQYKEAIKLGLDNPDIYSKLLKLSKYIKQKEELVDYVTNKYKDYKERFKKRLKKADLKKWTRLKR